VPHLTCAQCPQVSLPAVCEIRSQLPLFGFSLSIIMLLLSADLSEDTQVVLPLEIPVNYSCGSSLL
jgi:hypothetical protein